MEVRNKIWEEIKQAKSNAICIRRYNSLQRQLNCLYNVFIATAATIGTISTRFNMELSIYALVSIAFVSLVKSIFPQILQPEQELCNLDALMDYYNSFANKLEYLFYQFDEDKITEEEVVEKLFNMKYEECNKQSQMNKLIRFIPWYIQNDVDKEIKIYLDEVYYDKYEHDEK